MSTSTIFYSLACGHVVAGNERITIEMECYTDKKQKVVDIHVHEWHAKCAARGCKWARWTGLSRALCISMANNHVFRNPSHNGIIEYVANPEAVKVRNKLVKFKLIGF